MAVMNSYDLTIVLDGKTTAAKKKAFVEKIEKLVDSFEGKTQKVKDLGQKDLAYAIGKINSGLFLQFPLELNGENAKKLNDKLRVEETIIRYLLIRGE